MHVIYVDSCGTIGQEKERERGKNGISTERRKEKTIEDAVKTGATRKRDRCARCIKRGRKQTTTSQEEGEEKITTDVHSTCDSTFQNRIER